MAVVKANAYGHGLETVGRALNDADAFAVARLGEARRLRQAGVLQPIVLLEGVWDAVDQTAAINLGCELVVHTESQLELLQTHTGGPVTVWLKIDTGMTRLGFLPEHFDAALQRLQAIACVREIRLMTHFSNADESSSPKTHAQLDAFSSCAKNFSGDISVANSAATFDLTEIASLRERIGFRGEQWLRPGIALYGVSPFQQPATGSDLGLLPAMEFQARLIGRKYVPAGTAVGYQETWIAPRDTWIGTLAAGYGDGYSRHLANGTPVILNGRTVPLVGRVSMDMSTVDLGPDSTDLFGDIATLWGSSLPVETVAAHADALPYTFVTGILHRDSD